MLHQIGGDKDKAPDRTCFSDRERALLVAIAEAAMPAGRFVPVGGAPCVARAEGYLAEMGDGAAEAFRGLLKAIDATALARYLRPFVRLSVERRLAVLEGWRTGNYLRRTALQGLLFVLKGIHYDDPALFRGVGFKHGIAPPATVDTPRYVRERTQRAADFDADEELECDAVVVGTGAGGAVVARELAERGHTVILLEEGEYHDRRDFTGRPLDTQLKLYRNIAGTTTLGNVTIPVPIGRSVGGTTTVNNGTCFRVPARVLTKWRDQYGLTEMTPDHLAPYFERVEEVLGVAPGSAQHLGGVAKVIARGCEALGYHHHAALQRNAPNCDGQGVCCFGCPSDAKRSTNVSYVPLALRAGAQLITGARVERIVTEHGRASGVVARAIGGGKKRLTVKARAVVIACGTFYTPVLLDQSGLAGASGQLGRNLSIHPATAAFAWYDEPLDIFAAIPQGYSIEEFHDEGILFEGATVPPDMAAAQLRMIGPRFVELVEKFRSVASFGFMIEDTSRGRVWNRHGKPVITYVLNDKDVARLKRGMEILARVFFAAGASVVAPIVHGFDELRGEADLARFRAAKLTARDFDLSAYHPLGTARMGGDPRSSVVDASSQHHQVPGLYVTDGASVPSSLAVNPQLTIMALAARAAERISDRL